MALTSLINLASTYDSVIKTFEHIHFANTFSFDYADCMLKLANVKLRLSRWGGAVGLSSVDEYATSIYGTKVVEEDIPQAINLLGAIHAALETAKDSDREYNAYDPIILIAYQELSYADLSLHEVHRQIIRRRQNHLSVVEKATWVLRDRERFKVMINDIADKIRELEDLFPATQRRKEAIIEEAFEFSTSLRVLREVICEQDGALAEALDSILDPLGESINITVCGNNVYTNGVGVTVPRGGTFTQHVGNGLVATVHGGNIAIQSTKGGTITQHFGPLE
ncbi:unnamed protein product [Clonostachys byssicola]|uniref:Prion-inhibition and propagation HeLo domain-containing protein n=1 Tax=Clonostachys byssicola TaxID=160290 RepID=A0A9N9UBA6_9HYPO|nr:unnamed protein product [Clonostachys byssicola]